MANTHAVQVRRVYEHRERGDGTRVLVDRIWPRGRTKEKPDVDECCKQIAPSNELRKWYNHVPERFDSSLAAIRTSWRTPRGLKL